jgi:hypothetical protein
LVAKRHVMAVPSGSTAGIWIVRRPFVCIWMIAGTTETGLPVLPGVRSTFAVMLKFSSWALMSVEMRQQL